MSFWELPEGWQWKPISTIAKDTERRNPTQSPDESFYYVDVGSVDNEKGEVDIPSVGMLIGKDAPSRARKVVEKGDVIFATVRPYLKNIAIIPDALDDQICSTGFCVLRPKKDLTETDYLYRACRADFFINQLIKKQRGASYPAVTDGDVFDALVPIPYPDDPPRSLDVQRRIVARIEALLSEVREMRALQAEIEADTSRLLDTVLADAYAIGQPLPEGWELKWLPEVCQINPRRPRINRHDDAPTSFVPMEDVDEIEGRFKRIQVKLFREVKRGYTYFEEGDVLLAKITPSMENGKTAIARKLIDGIGFGTTEFHVFRPHDGVMPEWLHYFIRRTQFRREAKQNFRGAVGQQRVPIEFLEKCQIPLPNPSNPTLSLEHQRRIVSRIDTISLEVRDMYQANQGNLDELSKLEQAILAQAFRGEL